MASLAGKFLVAKSSLKDKLFGRSVILMLQHSEEGAFGLIINRPGPHAELPIVLYLGGPCSIDGLLLLHGHAEWNSDGNMPEIIPGVFLGTAECIERVTKCPEPAELRFRLFSGYSGWGPDQLEREMTEGSWAVVSATAEEVFEVPVEELWARLVPPGFPEPSLN